MKHIVIVGAGMSGMAAAIMAAGERIKVSLIERQERIGKKILLTGNGRCNLSNKDMDSSHYITDNPDILEEILKAYGPEEIPFRNSLGLMTKEKNGCIYPLSGQAATVLNVLRLRLSELNICIRTDYEVCSVYQKGGMFYIENENGNEIITADVLILACGGKAGVYKEQSRNGYHLCHKLGHHVLPCYPALVQTICEGDYFKSVSGVRADVHISLHLDDRFIARETGELQITDKGLSGIAVFQLTRYLGTALKEGKKGTFIIDFLPGIDEKTWLQLMTERKNNMADRTAEDLFTGILHKKLILMMLKQLNISPACIVREIDDGRFRELITLFKCFHVNIKGLNDFSHAQISTGGVPLAEVDSHSASALVPNLYITGEMLNVAGACGGYNLHFATATGYLAGKHARETLLRGM